MEQRSILRALIVVTKAASYRFRAPIVWEVHSHPDEWQLLYVVSGTGRIRIGDEWHDVYPRDLYLFSPGMLHDSEDAPDACPAMWDFRFTCPTRCTMSAFLSGVPSLFRQVQDPLVLQLMQQLVDEFSARRENWLWLCGALAEALLLRIGRLAPEHAVAAVPRRTGLHAELMAEIRRYIHLNFSERLTVEGLARQASMSPRRFAAVFREASGKPPMRYVTDIRVDRAAEMLLDGRWTVSEVAYRTGFGTGQYLSRVFAQRRGLPPSQYRQAMLAGRDGSTGRSGVAPGDQARPDGRTSSGNSVAGYGPQ